MKVVSKALYLSRGICQNPELASRVENTWAPASSATNCSTAGGECLSLQTFLLRWARSTQMQTFTLPFGTTTIPVHNCVGSLTRVMTPCFTILASSSFTGCIRRIATRLGTVIVNGLAPSSCRIVYSPFSLPKPLKRSGVSGHWALGALLD